MTAAVDIRDVFRVYQTAEGDAAALQGLTLQVAERELVVVLGPSGSGKTSLLRLVAGLDRPSAGTVRVFGLDVTRLPRRARAEYRARELGYVDQHYWRSLDPGLPARELVGLQLALGGASRRERQVRADELLERVGLADRARARPTELSGGEQQRVAVCAALAHRPRLFLADEPTGELDAVNARRLYALLATLAREERCTTIIVSHDPLSSSIADRTIRVRDGRVSEEAAMRTGATERIVVGRGGWLRVPEELLLEARIGTRASAHLSEEGILLQPAEGQEVASREPASLPAVRPVAPSRRGVAAAARALVQVLGSGRRRTMLFTGGLDARFEFGKVTALTGPSGSGKTSLLHLLAGLALPAAGDVEVLGTRLAALDRAGRAEFRREHIALIGQQLTLVPFLSARENVEVALALRRVAPADATRLALEALEAVGLAERSEQRVSRLSAGERQRVALARSLAARPAVLLADEPTAHLDQANVLAIGALLTKLAAETGTAVVCATHDPLFIEQADAHLELDRISTRAGVSHAADAV